MDYLELIALGSTDTILAFDLAKENIQAIDIGHIDLEYVWFRMKAKVNIPWKHVNEVHGGLEAVLIDDYNYSQSIIAEL